MKPIVIQSVKHEDQRYDTVGDFFEMPEDFGGELHIRVSEMGNDDYEFLVALHELVEQRLCQKRGITNKQIDAFDRRYEAKRKKGDDSEPGDDPKAPYRREHLFATGIEKLVAAALDIDWKTYEEAIMSL